MTQPSMREWFYLYSLSHDGFKIFSCMEQRVFIYSLEVRVPSLPAQVINL